MVDVDVGVDADVDVDVCVGVWVGYAHVKPRLSDRILFSKDGKLMAS